jgi:hypothetical protein
MSSYFQISAVNVVLYVCFLPRLKPLCFAGQTAGTANNEFFVQIPIE